MKEKEDFIEKSIDKYGNLLIPDVFIVLRVIGADKVWLENEGYVIVS